MGKSGVLLDLLLLDIKKGKIKKASKGQRIPLEASYWHLLETPFHNLLPKGWRLGRCIYKDQPEKE
jgi:hypothetical protein